MALISILSHASLVVQLVKIQSVLACAPCAPKVLP